MAKLADAWAWTVAKRVGLFSDAPRKASPLAMKPEAPPAGAKAGLQREALANVRPHRLWLRFWSERFEVVQVCYARMRLLCACVCVCVFVCHL